MSDPALMKRYPRFARLVAFSGFLAASAWGSDAVTLRSLLNEMTDPGALARFPKSGYLSLQSSSYNRASTHREQADRGTSGWFADSDGVGFIRTETREGKTEWVVMEHSGPGCITRMWTPFFYYDFGNRVGPNVRIYLDGATVPVIDESLIRLVRGEGSFPPVLATKTARAGDSYVPIPFARGCKITLTDKAFYNIINFRAYPEGTKVETFTREGFKTASRELAAAEARLKEHEPVSPIQAGGGAAAVGNITPGGKLRLELPRGPGALSQFSVRIPGVVTNASALRSTVISMTFDGDETVWAPVGDFFSNADSLHPYRTFYRTVTSDGSMICRWAMPYAKSGTIRLENLGSSGVAAELQARTGSWKWDSNSMHFHARWRPDELVPGSPFQDWNFVTIEGRGVYVGDSWTVLNPQEGWWGEGDEKIYVDAAWEQGFPTHFGTGSEDYYGWAGGVNPTRADEFGTPFLANVRVGGLNADTKGYNICTRMRGLDAIPFERHLAFDMESSFGVDIRHPWDLLGYSVVTYWYATPGARHNRPPLPQKAALPILSLEDATHASAMIRAKQTTHLLQ